MKRKITLTFMRSLAVIALMLAANSAQAYDFMYNGLAYNLDGDGTSVYVTYTSTNSDNNYGGSLTNVVIPSKITFDGGVSYNVTGIGQRAFYYCSNLQSITIPSSVKSIGNEAFYNTNIKKLTISSVDAWLSTTLNAWITTPHEMYVGSSLLTSVTLPSTVSSVGPHFMYTTSIKSVTIPNSVTEIGTNSFLNCTGLTTLNLGSGVKTIGQGAFSGCAALTSVTFPASLKTLLYNAFQNCSGLTALNIPENVETIESGVFSGCTGIKQLTWNAINLTTTGNMPTSNIEMVTIGNKVQTIPNNFVSGSKITSVAFHSSVKTIGSSAFNGCANLTAVAIPNGCTVGSQAFANCSALQSVTIPATINVSNTNIFQNCNSIKKLTWNATNVSSQFVPTANIEQVTIGGGVTELPQYFLQNAKITSLSLPSSLTSIGSYAFQNCSGITSLTIPENLTSVGSNVFSGCNNITQLTWNAINLTTNGGISTSNITKVIIGSSVQYLPSNFVRGSRITAVTIPSSVTTIDPSAFESCSLLTSITIPSSVRSWGSSMFKNCTSLKTVSLPSTMLAIPQEMFYGCTSLASAPLPANMISIGNSAFYNCTGLTALTIPEKLNSIGSNSFYGCSNIIQLTWNAINLSTNGGISTSNITKVTIGSKVQTIPSNFVRGSKITSVTFPSSVKSIGASAFASCTSLTSATLPTAITSIESYTFQYCSSLKSISIPNNVTSIGSSAFSGCSSLSKLKLGANLEVIGSSAFAGTNIVVARIPENVSLIENYAFGRCYKLVKVYFEGEYYNGGYAFDGCPIKVRIGKSSSCNVVLDPNTSFVVDGITYVITDMTNRKVKIVDVDETKCASDIEVKKVKYRNVEFTPNEIGVAALAGNYTVQNFNVGDNVKNLPEYSFYSCDALRSIDMKNTQTIGQYAFAESGLYKASLPNSVLTIDQHAFENCTRMTEFVAGTGVSTVYQYVLAGCSALRRVELGANVSQINANSFNGCNKIKTLRVRRSTPPTAASGVFNDIDKWTCTLYVPKGTVDTYKNAYEWKTFFFISDDETEPSDGDVDGNGKVNVSDVTALINMILGVTTMDQNAGDVDGNGKVNVSDVTALINIILGLI